jgi:hypothetical protein
VILVVPKSTRLSPVKALHLCKTVSVIHARPIELVVKLSLVLLPVSSKATKKSEFKRLQTKFQTVTSHEDS